VGVIDPARRTAAAMYVPQETEEVTEDAGILFDRQADYSVHETEG
jgi:hypothetical protein